MRILLWDLYEKEVVKTLRVDSVETIESIDWAPDSRRLALIGTGYGQSDLYMLDVYTEELVQLTGSPQREDHPTFSPDGLPKARRSRSTQNWFTLANSSRHAFNPRTLT